jgi:hypothetical protein
VFIFTLPLSLVAKMQHHFLELLEMNFARHSTLWETFLLLPPTVGVSLRLSPTAQGKRKNALRGA